MPLPFGFQGKGVVHQQVVPCASQVVHFEDLVNKKRKQHHINNYNRGLVCGEPTSVLDNISSSPSPPTSTSTLSSSLGGGGGGAVAAVSGNQSSKWPPPPESQETTSSNVGVADFQNQHQHQHHQLPPVAFDVVGAGGATEKCSGMEDWESVLSESGQDFRWIMGDVEDPSMGLTKMLHGGSGGATADFEFNGGFGVVDQGFLGLDSNNPPPQIGNFPQIPHKFADHLPPAPPIFHTHHHRLSNTQNPIFNEPQLIPFDIKPQIFNPQHQLQIPPPAPPKRYNPESTNYNPQIPKAPFLDSGQTPLHFLPQRPSKASELGHHHQEIVDQIFKSADLIHSGNNPILAQGILARLNHQLSPLGKPFSRAAFYFKEALQLLLNSVVNNLTLTSQISPIPSPFSLIFKIGAYKSFSEISPFLQFANFTCNQAILEVLDGFDQIHIVDFDIGYGGQWASLMQELALRPTGAPSVKITAFASPATHDQIELGLTRENLIQFANEINIRFDFDIVNVDLLASASWNLPFHLSDNEAVAVNLPVNLLSNYQIALPLVLRFVKNLAPKIVVSVDRGVDRTDLPFSNHLIHALQSLANLLESLDAVNANPDALQKIERFLIQPSVEKIVTGRFRFPEKTPHWRSMFVSAGFSPIGFSNFTETQAGCVAERTPVRRFHVEKRQSALVLCWQGRELVSVSAWRC